MLLTTFTSNLLVVQKLTLRMPSEEMGILHPSTCEQKVPGLLKALRETGKQFMTHYMT